MVPWQALSAETLRRIKRHKRTPASPPERLCRAPRYAPPAQAAPHFRRKRTATNPAPPALSRQRPDTCAASTTNAVPTEQRQHRGGPPCRAALRRPPDCRCSYRPSPSSDLCAMTRECLSPPTQPAALYDGDQRQVPHQARVPVFAALWQTARTDHMTPDTPFMAASRPPRRTAWHLSPCGRPSTLSSLNPTEVLTADATPVTACCRLCSCTANIQMQRGHSGHAVCRIPAGVHCPAPVIRRSAPLL